MKEGAATTVSKVNKKAPSCKRSRRRPRKFSDGPRTHAVTIMLTDREHQLLQQHLRRKRVSNRSRYLRSILLRDILDKLHSSPPSLFDHLPSPPQEEDIR